MWAGALALGAALALPGVLAPGSPAAQVAEPSSAHAAGAPTAADTIPDAPYYGIPLRPPGQPFGRPLGYAAVAFPETPFNVSVGERGVYAYDLRVSAPGIRARPGVVHVLWLASPELSHVERVGVLDGDAALRAHASFDNKFLLFVTEEASAEVSRPTGRVVLSGISRAGRMESMFSHDL